MTKLKTVYKLIKRPNRIIRVLGDKKLFNWLPDKPYLRLLYKAEIGKALNIDNPQTFNEKLQWIKLYDRKPEYCTYVDKYEVREYIANTIGEEYLIPIIGVYESVDEIPWNDLPEQFVLKCTHGSGSNIICPDKSKLDIEDAKKKLNKWMKKNWYWFGREWPYKNLKPRVICEEFISNTTKVPNDLKVMCFNGEAKIIELHENRFSESHTQNYYDIDWNVTEISQESSFAVKSRESEPTPTCLQEMIKLSEIIAKNKYHVRVDWYEVNGRLYFGEITFFEASGLLPFDRDEYDLLLGSWIRLPIDKADK